MGEVVASFHTLDVSSTSHMTILFDRDAQTDIGLLFEKLYDL